MNRTTSPDEHNNTEHDDRCERCPVLTQAGERCKNHSCKESNTPLCHVHVQKLEGIIQNFHELKSGSRARVLPEIAHYLGERSVEFNLKAKDGNDEPLDDAKAALLDKYNALSANKKANLAPCFCSYLTLRGCSYRIDLGSRT